MYVRHFLKMLVGLMVMGAVGVAGLVVADYYSKVPTASAVSGNQPSQATVTQNPDGTIPLQPMRSAGN